MQHAVRQIIDPVLEGMDQEFGSAYSAVAYGSAARDEFTEGVSDVNLLLVCETLRPETLRRMSPVLLGLRHLKQAPPLLIERHEWDRAADVFPIEVTDMQLAHETLRGEVPVAPMKVDPADLRRSLEQELRGKLLRLRQAYVVHQNEPRALEDVAARTVTSIATLFRVALALYGREVPGRTPACLAAAGTALGVNTGPVLTLWEQRRRKESSCPPELFEGYLAAVGTAVRVIDQFTRGGN